MLVGFLTTDEINNIMFRNTFIGKKTSVIDTLTKIYSMPTTTQLQYFIKNSTVFERCYDINNMYAYLNRIPYTNAKS